MRIHGLLAGAALVAAVAGTSFLTSLAAPAAMAAGGPYELGNSVPSYYTPWTNPLIPEMPPQAGFGQ